MFLKQASFVSLLLKNYLFCSKTLTSVERETSLETVFTEGVPRKRCQIGTTGFISNNLLYSNNRFFTVQNLSV